MPESSARRSAEQTPQGEAAEPPVYSTRKKPQRRISSSVACSDEYSRGLRGKIERRRAMAEYGVQGEQRRCDLGA